MPFTIERNDLATMRVDAVVVAANERLLITGGVGATVADAAGFANMQAACNALGGCPTGSAVATPGFRLPAKVVVHAVGPQWIDGRQGEQALLRSAYDSALRCAVESDARSIALPLISAGSYGFPPDVSLAIARAAIRDFLNRHDVDVHLVLYDRAALVAGLEAYGEVAAYIDDRYVEDHPTLGTAVFAPYKYAEPPAAQAQAVQAAQAENAAPTDPAASTAQAARAAQAENAAPTTQAAQAENAAPTAPTAQVGNAAPAAPTAHAAQVAQAENAIPTTQAAQTGNVAPTASAAQAAPAAPAASSYDVSAAPSPMMPASAKSAAPTVFEAPSAGRGSKRKRSGIVDRLADVLTRQKEKTAGADAGFGRQAAVDDAVLEDKAISADQAVESFSAQYGATTRETARTQPSARPPEEIPARASALVSEESPVQASGSVLDGSPPPVSTQLEKGFSRQIAASASEDFAPTLEAPARRTELADLLDALDEPFSTTLLALIDARGLTDAEVYKRANMSRQLFSKIRGDATYRPTKKTVLALAIALRLDLAESADLLRRAGFALSHSSKADVIVEYYIANARYDIFEINEMLYAFDQPLL